ncbi:hypothetical protein AV530_006386 [Patagioenas fasciata monilis]|uniref:Uncharacterized protein n=1 Tax=Patagioenas fasciata monilis TaxID=372326 RepID=A0A1V4KGI2_PATFA|nr:hypothetical protein AV530_006386 [Patagioenas fasciata monilis]
MFPPADFVFKNVPGVNLGQRSCGFLKCSAISIFCQLCASITTAQISHRNLTSYLLSSITLRPETIPSELLCLSTIWQQSRVEYPSLECKPDGFAGKTSRFILHIKGVKIISACLQTAIHYMRESHITAIRTEYVTVIFSSDKSPLQRYVKQQRKHACLPQNFKSEEIFQNNGLTYGLLLYEGCWIRPLFQARTAVLQAICVSETTVQPEEIVMELPGQDMRLICTQIPGRGGLRKGICMYRRLDTVVAP